jgi:arylsulfatase A-like enzyme/Flp pilus assembly protein TadD
LANKKEPGISLLVASVEAWVRRAILVLALVICGCSDRADTHASVVLVTIDTLRADHIGSYGGLWPTPTLDRLASEGSLFLDCTTHSPLTLPSHASILTGTTPIYHGVKDNGRYRLPEELDTLAEILKGIGYSTAAFVGALPVHSRFGLAQGFDVYDEKFMGERRAAEVTAGAVHWIEQQEDGPFFLWVHVFDPHSPYEPPEPFREEYGDTYEGEVVYVDDALGPLFSVVGGDILTVITSDHGESLGEHGEDTHALFIYDATLRVPLIFRGPGVPRGASFREQARSIDIVPTILELVGQTGRCDTCQGRSLVGLMRGEEVRPEPSYSESYFPRLNLGWSELRAVRWQGWKYIAAPQPELYNLSSDPGELANLAEEEPERIEKLAAELSHIERGAAGPFDIEPERLDPETSRLLSSLGYVSAEAALSHDGSLPDPKSRIELWRSLVEAKDLSDKGENEKAIAEFESILERDAKLLQAHYHLSEAYYRMGDYEAAADRCQRLLSIDPKHGRAALLLAESLFRLGRIDEAEKVYEMAAELDRISADPLVRLANLRLESGNFDEARRILDQAAHRDPGDALVAYVRGKINMLEGNIGEAEKAFRDAVAADPAESGARVDLVNLLINQRRFAEAETLLRSGMSMQSRDSSLHAALGRVLAMSGRTERAIQSFETALELAPESPVVMTSLGIAYLQSGRNTEGLALLTRSLELEPNQPRIQVFLEQQRR